MSKDDTRMGKPSAWSSDEPVVAPPVIHRHPLSPGVRVILVIFGVMLAMSFGGTLWVVIDGQRQDDVDRQAVVKQVTDDINKAKAAGEARDAANNEKSRKIVCTVIKESLKPTAATRALAHQLKCDVPAPTPAPSPQPTATVYIFRPGPTPQSRPQASSSRRPSPATTRSPSPHPSPTQSCLLPKPLPCP